MGEASAKRSKTGKSARRSSTTSSRRAKRVAGGFVALPFTLPALPGHGEPVVHFVYARPAKTDDEHARKLFVGSLPWGCTAADVQAAFGAESAELVSIGRTAEDDAATLLEVERVHGEARAEMAIPPLFLAPSVHPQSLVAALQPKPNADVSFASTAARDAAFAQTKPRPWPSAPRVTTRQAHALLRPPLDLVQRHADAWMAAFDAGGNADAVDDADESELVEVVGDDGWTTVVRGGKHGRSKVAAAAAQDADPLRYATGQTSVGVASRRFSMAAAVGGAEAAADVGGKKPKAKTLHGFYKFQRADTQQHDLRQAKRQWEDTKTQLSIRRRDRRLKPY